MAKNFMTGKPFWIIGLAMVLAVAGALYWYKEKDPLKAVSNFDECAEAGYPILESYPPQCKTPDGRIFIQEISSNDVSNETATSGDEPRPGSQVHDLPVSPAVAAARAHLAERLSIETKNILVLSAFEKDWPNSCLGLEEAGDLCAQVIVPGFEVMLKAQGRTYIYRTTSDGSVVKAEN